MRESTVGKSDNPIFARIRKKLDLKSNVKKEDRVVITGMPNNTPPTKYH
jgi:hypothetical protein